MKLRNTKIGALAALGVMSILTLPQTALGDSAGRQYQVTITNLTSGQPFTPPVLATHSKHTRIFNTAEDASVEIQALAENGDAAPLIAALSANTRVHDVVVGTAPLVPDRNPGDTGFGSSETYVISARGNARYLSFASMLICTNDGFTGLNSVRLPSRKRTVYAVGYDASTEQNTEDFADIVPPCQGLIGVMSDDAGTGATNPMLSEDGFIIPHSGIHGGSDLQAPVHDWSDPVAKIVIERVSNH
jgi:hypothetical protein